MLFTRRGRGRLHQRRDPLRRDDPPVGRRRHAVRAAARRRRGSSPASRSTPAPSRSPCAEGETVTEGLDGLRERLAEYRELGARFAKWRATYTITDELPSRVLHRRQRARARALRRAVPGSRDRADRRARGADGRRRTRSSGRASVTAARARGACSTQLVRAARVRFEGTLLKPNMVLPGYDCPKQASDDEVAEATRRGASGATVPAAVPGIVFLSGGQSDEQATARLNAMNQLRPAPVAAELLVRPCAPGGGAQGVEGRGRQRRRRPAGVPRTGRG